MYALLVKIQELLYNLKTKLHVLYGHYLFCYLRVISYIIADYPLLFVGENGEYLLTKNIIVTLLLVIF